MDELAEALTLIQTGKIDGFPVVLIGTEYWAPLLALLDDMIREGAVSASDLNLFKVTDDLDATPCGISRPTPSIRSA